MVTGRFKRQRRRLRGKKRKAIIYPKISVSIDPYKATRPVPSKTISNTIQLSEVDRITYIFQADHKNNVLEVTNVSQESLIEGKLITVRRFDSEHGYLHLHTNLSSNDLEGITTTVGVKKKGDQKSWLTWAIDDIKKRYLEYKRGFLKRNKLPLDNQVIDRDL